MQIFIKDVKDQFHLWGRDSLPGLNFRIAWDALQGTLLALDLDSLGLVLALVYAELGHG